MTQVKEKKQRQKQERGARNPERGDEGGGFRARRRGRRVGGRGVKRENGVQVRQGKEIDVV